MKNIIVSILGTRKDVPDASGTGWSPSLSLVQHPETFTVDEYHLIYNTGHQALAEDVQDRIIQASPRTEVILDEIPFKDPWDFAEVLPSFFDYAKKPCFHRASTDYYVHVNTGTNVERMALFWLVYAGFLRAKLVQSGPTLRVFDVAGSLPEIQSGIHKMRLEGVTFLKDGIPTRNTVYNETISELEKIALSSTDPILIIGPTGAGKTQLVNRLYDLKKKNGRVTGRFISVNCATLDPNTAKSELFGHVKGAFTDAHEKREGFIKTAENGILFLDEIGDLSREVQTMLLKAIEEHEFYPLGSDTPVRCNFQLICGTNQELTDTERFRDDLLQRINRWTFRIPGLAERREDIEPNFEYELGRLPEELKRGVTITDEAREQFMTYALDPNTTWPGNFRELRNMVVRMATLAQDDRIETKDVTREIARLHPNLTSNQAPDTNHQPPANDDLNRLLGPDYTTRYDDIELVTIRHVIEVCRSSASKAEAGRRLYNVSRISRAKLNDSDRLAKYLKRFHLSFKDIIGTP